MGGVGRRAQRLRWRLAACGKARDHLANNFGIAGGNP
jgi:hypothetical protein